MATKAVPSVPPNPSGDLMFEEKAGGFTWAAFLVGVLIGAAMIAMSMPLNNIKNVGLLVGGVCIAGFSGFLTIAVFRKRNESTQYYSDRAEVCDGSRLMHKLAYADVEKVAYGFKGDGEQFLTFSGARKEPLLSLLVMGDTSKAKPTEVNEEKLIALRDSLYEIVVARMLQRAKNKEGAAWFDTFSIRLDGLLVGDAVKPWSQVSVQANEKNGKVVIEHDGNELGRTSMIEDNIVAGLMAIERIREAIATRSTSPVRG